MTCNGVLTQAEGLRLFNHPSPQTFYSPPLRLEMTASAFLTRGYFQQPHVHISEAIITD